MATQTQRLTAITREQALVPGTMLYSRYDLVIDNQSMIRQYVAHVERKLKESYPLWSYMGATINYEEGWVEFQMLLNQYQMDMVTQEIIPLDPETLKPVEPKVTMYYASAGSLAAIIGVAAAAIAGFMWLTHREDRIARVADSKAVEAIVNDPDLTGDQKAEAIKQATETADKPTVIGDAVKAASGTFAVMVALTLLYLILGRR